MSITDPIADLLTRIRNAQTARHEATEVPFSRVKVEVLRILKEEGFVSGYKVNEKEPFSTISVVLKYDEKRQPAIRSMRRVSKPGRRVYASKDEIPLVLGGMGINIVTTSKGILTGKKAKQQGIGGEILCEVY